MRCNALCITSFLFTHLISYSLNVLFSQKAEMQVGLLFMDYDTHDELSSRRKVRVKSTKIARTEGTKKKVLMIRKVRH